MSLRKMQHYWRSAMVRNAFVGAPGGRAFASSTTPKAKLFSPTADGLDGSHPKSRGGIKGDYAPVMIVFGFVLMAVSIGVHTVKQQLLHSPSVQVNKKRRESLAEVYDPHAVVGNSDKFIDKSFLRKIAHIQDENPTVAAPAKPNIYTRSRDIETVESAREK